MCLLLKIVRTLPHLIGSMAPPPRPMSFGVYCNHNVFYTFLYKFSDGIAQGIWSLASMATYIYLLENNSTKVFMKQFCAGASEVQQLSKRCLTSFVVIQYVGLAQGIQGIFGAMSAVPGT